MNKQPRRSNRFSGKEPGTTNTTFLSKKRRHSSTNYTTKKTKKAHITKSSPEELKQEKKVEAEINTKALKGEQILIEDKKEVSDTENENLDVESIKGEIHMKKSKSVETKKSSFPKDCPRESNIPVPTKQTKKTVIHDIFKGNIPQPSETMNIGISRRGRKLDKVVDHRKSLDTWEFFVLWEKSSEGSWLNLVCFDTMESVKCLLDYCSSIKKLDNSKSLWPNLMENIYCRWHASHGKKLPMFKKNDFLKVGCTKRGDPNAFEYADWSLVKVSNVKNYYTNIHHDPFFVFSESGKTTAVSESELQKKISAKSFRNLQNLKESNDAFTIRRFYSPNYFNLNYERKRYGKSSIRTHIRRKSYDNLLQIDTCVYYSLKSIFPSYPCNIDAMNIKHETLSNQIDWINNELVKFRLGELTNVESINGTIVSILPKLEGTSLIIFELNSGSMHMIGVIDGNLQGDNRALKAEELIKEQEVIVLRINRLK